jgi:multidrug efflux pump subunit AcrB
MLDIFCRRKPVAESIEANPHAERAIAKISKGPFGFFITRIRVVILIILAIILLGVSALFTLPREADPEVKIPIAVVTTAYPGASPSDVESLVTNKIEEKLEQLDNVDLITSSSMLGISSIVVEFEAEADLDSSIQDLKDKVDEVTNLPAEVDDPFVTEIRANDFALISFSLAADLPESQLKQLGELVQDELESITDVSQVLLSGVREREFSVVVDESALQRLNISLSQVVGVISATNMDMPLGDISIDNIDYNLRTVGRFTSIEDLKKVVVAQSGTTVIFLNDVASIEDTFAERNSISRISIDGQPTRNSVSLQIYKKTGGNILNIVDEAKEIMTQLQENKTIPQGVDVQESSDFSSFIRKDLNTLGGSGLQAVFFIFLILWIALNFKEASISLLAIPLTFLMTFIFLQILDFTINSMTLFALVLSLGLLVDTFIVILEGIFHNMRLGYNAVRASLLSVANYKKPLTAGMLTTVSAFVPMLLVSGIMGEYLRVLPITISLTLFSALFISFVIVPGLSGMMLRCGSAEERHKSSVLERYVTNHLRAWYKVKIIEFLDNRKTKIKFSIILGILFITSLGLLVSGVIKVELFPKADTDFAYINLKMPIGTNLEATNEVVEKIESHLFDKKDIKSFVTTVGSAVNLNMGGGSSSSHHLANVNLNLVEAADRDRKSYDIIDDIRNELEIINEGEIEIEELGMGPPTGAPIEARITGDDLIVLDELVNRVEDALSQIEGVINITSTQEISPADFTFKMDNERLARAGLTASDVASTLRIAIYGVAATETLIDNDEVDVVVRYDQSKIASVEDIKNLTIINRQGEKYKLSHLVDFSLEPALAKIRHRDFSRSVNVQAYLRPGFNATQSVIEIEERLSEYQIPTGYEISFGGEVEDIEESFTELWNAMIVAVLLIVLILVLQFNSFTRPLMIVMMLPLMLIGVVVGMLLLQLPFSFAVFLGLISLTGIVVNDAIVLVDKAERNINENKMMPKEAIADAGDTRLQPILLTSITTIIGVIPLAIADEFWFGLSIAIIFGLAFATMLQLFVIPMLYLQFLGKRIIKERGSDY